MDLGQLRREISRRQQAVAGGIAHQVRAGATDVRFYSL
jgi:hypothetical protein